MEATRSVLHVLTNSASQFAGWFSRLRENSLAQNTNQKEYFKRNKHKQWPGKKFFLEAGIFFPRKISAGHCDNNEHDHTSYSSWLTKPSIYFITKLKRNLQKQKPSTRSEKTSRVICYWRLFFVCFVSQSVVITGNISNLSGGLITRCLPELPYI